MKRRTLPVAVALAATTAFLLTACGSSDTGSKDNDKIAGSNTGGSNKSTPSASVSDSVDRPDIKLASGVEDVFENWETGNTTKDAVLADAARAQTAINEAILKGKTDTPGLTFYYKGEALTTSVKWVQKWVDAGLTYTGTTRYFNPKIELFNKKSAGISFCADETKAYNKDRKTGKVDKSPATDDSYVLYNTRLEKNEQGVWQTSSGTSVRGSKACVQ
ncbi:lipoprotein [Streptomyces deserti]